MSTIPREVPDHYGALNLDRGTIMAKPEAEADAEVKAAFRREARKTHPDATRGDDDPFKPIQAAYAALKTAERRAEYELLCQPLAGLKSGRVHKAGSTFANTFGGSTSGEPGSGTRGSEASGGSPGWQPPKPRVSSRVLVHYSGASRVLHPSIWPLSQTERAMAWVIGPGLGVFTFVSIRYPQMAVKFAKLLFALTKFLLLFVGLFPAPVQLVFWLAVAAVLLIPATQEVILRPLAVTARVIYLVVRAIMQVIRAL